MPSEEIRKLSFLCGDNFTVGNSGGYGTHNGRGTKSERS